MLTFMYLSLATEFPLFILWLTLCTCLHTCWVILLGILLGWVWASWALDRSNWGHHPGVLASLDASNCGITTLYSKKISFEFMKNSFIWVKEWLSHKGLPVSTLPTPFPLLLPIFLFPAVLLNSHLLMILTAPDRASPVFRQVTPMASRHMTSHPCKTGSVLAAKIGVDLNQA